MKGMVIVSKRMIQESICDSESIANLSWFEECLMTRLITVCDDYGVYDARPAIIKNKVFPVKQAKESDISQGLQNLQKQGTIVLYTVDGKPYLQFTNWGKYQRLRFTNRKYPAYEDRDKEEELPQSAAICRKLPQVAASCRNLPQVAAPVEVM